MNQISSAVLILFTTSLSYAGSGAEAKTTDMYAPKNGSSEVYAGLGIKTGKSESGVSTTSYSGPIFVAQYAYGLSDNFAIYGNQKYSNLEYTTDPAGTKSKYSGAGNTTIGIKGLLDYGQTFFYYDASYQAGLFAKYKYNITSGEGTTVSTRPFLSVQAGVGGTLNMVGVGALLTFNAYQDGNSDLETPVGTTTTSNKAGTGTAWKIFTQLQMPWVLGLSYAQTTDAAYDTITNAIVTTQVKNESRTYSLYSILPIATSSELFFELQKPELIGTTTSDKYYIISASYRSTF